MPQVLEFHVRDSHLTGRADLGYVKFPLRSIPAEGHISTWLPVQVSCLVTLVTLRHKSVEAQVREALFFYHRAVGPTAASALWIGVSQVLCTVLQPWTPGKKTEGQLHVKLTYKPFEDDESNSGYREAEAYALMLQEQAITDIKSAAGD